jgi:hypothetical protein
MVLKEAINKYLNKKKIILNTNTCDVFYCKPNKISSQIKRLLNQEVIDCETSNYDDWVEIWIK